MTEIGDFMRRISVVFLLACAIGILFFSVKLTTQSEQIKKFEIVSVQGELPDRTMDHSFKRTI
ncbi:hypothetical protein [Shouchella patagoniensis]|uniref:hypothetical protein n=1 Tax=Shouchella patagoniensis TaxID=228576 RepID=UPI0009955088|nr:hypothetical protein [Shouchella patagoniensis]